MSQTKLEKGFQSVLKSIEIIQKELDLSFLDAYIENGENLLDDFHVRVLSQRPTPDAKSQIEKEYQNLKQLQLSPEEMRKVAQYVLLKGMVLEQQQPNHQLTPDALGFLFIYFIEELFPNKEKSLQFLDNTVGTGNLLLTILLNLSEAGYSVKGTGVDIDDTLLSVAAINSELTKSDVQLFLQDSLHPLLIDPVDVAIGDVPIGYYPDDNMAKKYLTSADLAHSYAHHLLLEQSMYYVKPNGYGLFLVPSDFLETEQTKYLTQWLKEKVYLQGIIKLPTMLFKEKSVGKSLIILQNPGDISHQANEVLVAQLPSLKDLTKMQQFFKKFAHWKLQNIE